MMVKECQSVVSDGVDHSELRASLDKYVAAVVLGLLDCYVVSEGGAERGSLSTRELVAAACQKTQIVELVAAAEVAKENYSSLAPISPWGVGSQVRPL